MAFTLARYPGIPQVKYEIQKCCEIDQDNDDQHDDEDNNDDDGESKNTQTGGFV